MNYKKLTICALVLLINGCASQKSMPFSATNEDFDYYFKNQVFKVNPGLVLHPQYGSVKYDNEIYLRDFAACSKESYSGVKLQFGSHEISDPKVLRQMLDDNAFLIFKGLIGSKSIELDSPMNKIFRDKSVTAKLYEITPLESKTIECVKSKGWSYPESTKK